MKQEEEEEEEESGDTFELDITVANPEKMGEGMSSYISYSIKTKTTMPDFKRPETTVRRRFSDFLGLHQRLAEKHINKGRIVPPAPEKSMLGEEQEGSRRGGGGEQEGRRRRAGGEEEGSRRGGGGEQEGSRRGAGREQEGRRRQREGRDHS